jgi:hypothetical protein
VGIEDERPPCGLPGPRDPPGGEPPEGNPNISAEDASCDIPQCYTPGYKHEKISWVPNTDKTHVPK